MKKVMYRASIFGAEINPIEIEKSTTHTVTYNRGGNVETERKATSYYSWWATKEEARQWLLEHYKKEIDRAKNIIASCESKIKKANEQ